MKLAGDTMTGQLTINSPAGNVFTVAGAPAGVMINLQKAGSGNACQLFGYAGANPRWLIQLGDTSAESGSNAGSNFDIYRYTDAGVSIDAPLTINRATGLTTLAALTVSASLNVNGSAGVVGPISCQSVGTSQGFTNSGGSSMGLNCTGNATNDSSTYFTNLWQGNPNWATIYCQAILSNSGGYACLQFADTSGGLNCQIRNGGILYMTGATAYKAGGGSWADTSDARIKTELGDYTVGLDAVCALRPITYTFIGNDTDAPPANLTAPGGGSPKTEAVPDPLVMSADDPRAKMAPQVPYPNSPHHGEAVRGTTHHGLIAQEVEIIFPEMVTVQNAYIDGVRVTDLRVLNTNPLIFAVVNAIKELAAPQPACAIYASRVQSIPKNTPTKIAYDTAEFDVTSSFDLSQYRFAPTTAGYYEINCGCGLAAGSVKTYTSIYKNGVEYRRSTTTDGANARLSTLLYLDGETDYVEGFVFCSAAFQTVAGGVMTSFSGSLIHTERVQ